MKVWFKRGLFALVSLAIIALVGGAIFLLTFNPNSYKQKLADIVYQQYQRTLKIDGNLELSLFPRIGLSVQGLSLSDRNSDAPFASLESARFAVALWPLISNRLVVDHVAVSGFKAWLVRDENGNFNFDDLLQSGAPLAQAGPVRPNFGFLPAAHASSSALAADSADGTAESSATPSQRTHAVPDILAKRVGSETDFQIDIAGLSLRNGEIHFYSKRSNVTARLVELELNTGRVTFGQPFDVDLKGRLFGDYPGIDAELTGQAQLKLEPGIKSYRAQRLDLRLQGRIDQLKAQSMSVKGNLAYNTSLRQFQATQLETSLQGELLGARPISQLQATLNSPRFLFDQANDQVSFEKLALRANGKAGIQSLELALDAPKALVSATQASADPVVATLKITGPQVLGLALHLQGLKGNSEKLYFDQAKAEGTLKRGTRVAQLKASSPLEWQPAGKWIKLHDIQAGLRIEDEANKASRYNLPFTGLADLNVGQSIYSSSFHIEADEALSQLSFSSKPEGEHTLLDIGLDAARLNLDELQSIFAMAAPDFESEPDPRPLPATGPEPQAPTGSSEVTSAVDQVLTSASFFPWLEHTRLDAKANIAQLSVHGLRLSDVQAELSSDSKAIHLKQMSARLYEGTLQAKGSADLQHQYQGSLELNKVQLGSLLLDGWGNDYLYGLADVKLNLKTQGATHAARMAALDGQAKLSVEAGGWRGIDIEQRVSDINEGVKNVFSGHIPAQPPDSDIQKRTILNKLQTQIEFKQGQGLFKNLRAATPLLSITQGKPASLDMVNGQMDLLLSVRLPQKMNAAQRKQWQSLRNVAIPLRVSGPWGQARYQVQWQDMKSAAVQKALQEGLLDLLDKQSPVEVMQQDPEQPQASLRLSQELGVALQANVPADGGSIGQTFKNMLGQ